MLSRLARFFHMIDLCLVGKNISHSKSQSMYEKMLQTTIKYTLYDITDEKELPSLDELLNKHQGMSITTPYKKSYLNQVFFEERMPRPEAINCICRVGEKYLATNTDFLAIKEIFNRDFYQRVEKIIILGDGVMSKLTQAFFDSVGVRYQVLARSKGDDLNQLNVQGRPETYLLINSCARAFVFHGKIKNTDHFWDYNYSLPHHQGLKSICNYHDGIELLELQARHALNFWKRNKAL